MRADMLQNISDAQKAEGQERDAERFRFLVSDPETGRHLLLLLSKGNKGTVADLRRMIDRIQASKDAAAAKLAAAKGEV